VTWEDDGDIPEQELWLYIETLLGTSATRIIYGGSEAALTKSWINDRFADYDTEAEIAPDAEMPYICGKLKSLREQNGMTVAECLADANKRLAKRRKIWGEQRIDEREWLAFENGFCPRAFEVLVICEMFDVEWDDLLKGPAVA
jgi:hypothetical protein